MLVQSIIFSKDECISIINTVRDNYRMTGDGDFTLTVYADTDDSEIKILS